MSRFGNYIKYHAKEFFAILFGVLATLCFFASMVISMLSGVVIDLSDILHYVILGAIFLVIVIGNINRSMMAISGILAFVFMETFALLYPSITYASYIGFSFANGETGLGLAYIGLFVAIGVMTASGILTYIQALRFLRGYRSNYRALRAWCLIFTIFLLISNILYPVVFTVLIGRPLLIATFLEPIAEGLMGVCVFFTVLRLKN